MNNTFLCFIPPSLGASVNFHTSQMVCFILGVIFISLCFQLITMHYHTPKQREIEFKPRIKLNHNIQCIHTCLKDQKACVYTEKIKSLMEYFMIYHFVKALHN